MLLLERVWRQVHHPSAYLSHVLIVEQGDTELLGTNRSAQLRAVGHLRGTVRLACAKGMAKRHDGDDEEGVIFRRRRRRTRW